MTSAEKLAAMIVDPLSEQMSQALGQQRVNLVNNVLLLRQAIEAVIRVARAEVFLELAEHRGDAIAELTGVLARLHKKRVGKKHDADLKAWLQKRVAALEKSAKVQAAVEQGRTTREPPRADIIEERGCAAAPASPVASANPEKP
jgi:hypothetical protein